MKTYRTCGAVARLIGKGHTTVRERIVDGRITPDAILKHTGGRVDWLFEEATIELLRGLPAARAQEVVC